MNEEKKEPRTYGSGNGTETVYHVEARYNFNAPREINGMLLDQRWKVVHFDKGPIGVRTHVFSAEGQRQGFLDYQSALALAHWFLANAEGYCTEVRLVRIELTHSYSTKEIGVGEVMTSARFSDGVFLERAAAQASERS